MPASCAASRTKPGRPAMSIASPTKARRSFRSSSVSRNGAIDGAMPRSAERPWSCAIANSSQVVAPALIDRNSGQTIDLSSVRAVAGPGADQRTRDFFRLDRRRTHRHAPPTGADCSATSRLSSPWGRRRPRYRSCFVEQTPLALLFGFGARLLGVVAANRCG